MENYYFIRPKKDIDGMILKGIEFIALETDQGIFHLTNQPIPQPDSLIGHEDWKTSDRFNDRYEILDIAVHICTRCNNPHVLDQELCESCDMDDYFEDVNNHPNIEPEYLDCFDSNNLDCDDNLKTGCMNCYNYESCYYKSN